MSESRSTTGTHLLDGSDVLSHLRSSGIDVSSRADVSLLGGGVSNLVIAIDDPPHRFVLKQSRAQLDVSDLWEAPPERIVTEAAALEVAADVAPGSVPKVLHVDAVRNIIVLERAPVGWSDWKNQLLSGICNESVGHYLGTWLSSWHRSTEANKGLTAAFHHDDAFRALRVEPFYVTTAERAPELARDVLACASEMVTRRRCLVHGDFSPKNVLLDQGSNAGLKTVDAWVIDFEVTSYGDPTFDLAFLMAHLMLKSLHRPDLRGGYEACTRAFFASYSTNASPSLRPESSYLLRHVACLVLARVKGKSPVEYLDATGQSRAWQLGSALLRGCPENLDSLFEIRDEVLS